MATVISLYAWFTANYVQFFSSLSILMVALQGLVRLTPTKTDDGAVERIGQWLTTIMDFLHIPNVKRADGSVVTFDANGKPEEKKAS